MPRQRKAAVVILILVLISVVMFAPRERTPAAGPGLETLPYARPGQFAVGFRELSDRGHGVPELSVWYPAAEREEMVAQTDYAYEIGIGGPLGVLTIAKTSGRAQPAAPLDPSAGPYPLVILSPGYAVGAPAYAWLSEHLASYGFVVIVPWYEETLASAANQFWMAALSRPESLRDVLDYAEDQSETGGAFAGMIDPERVAVAGHSIGGYAALAAAGARLDLEAFSIRCEEARARQDPAAWLCELFLPNLPGMADLAGLEAIPEGRWPSMRDDRVQAVIAMAGDAYLFDRAGLAEINIPVMAIGGTGDGDTPYLWGAHPTYEYTSSPEKARVGLEGADHMVFTGSCDRVSWIAAVVFSGFCTDPAWDKAAAHILVRHLTTAFLLAELMQDADAAAALVQEAFEIDAVSYDSQGFRVDP
jgi:predicted dienelactone hydrolase